MSGKEGARIFVGGLSWETTERELGAAFSRFGKVLDAQIMVERDTGRPRGFGFVTFTDRRAMEDAIHDMHNKELNGRQISVNKAEPRVGLDDPGYGYSSGYSSGGRGGYRGGSDDLPPGGNSDCFKCGRSGHWARECPSGGAGGGKFSSRPRFSRGGGGGGRDRFVGGDRYADRHIEDRYDGGRYGDRPRLDGKDSNRYSGAGGGRDRHANDNYPSAGDRYSGNNRYGSGPDRSLHDGYNKERSFDRDGGPRGGGDRYGTGGPRFEGGGGGGGGGYRERPGPYDRPSKGGRPSYEDRY